MFTGLVEAVGSVVTIDQQDHGVLLAIDQTCLSEARIGDSIAINGCCLTVTSVQSSVATFEAGEETLRRTNLGTLRPGSPVNLERSLQVGDRMGGHFVTGHVDCVGRISARHDDGEWCTMWFDVPDRWITQIVSKGSIAVDGISLTVVDVAEVKFSVALIPHTLENTTLGDRTIGENVNLETDVLAKYVARAVQAAAT